MMGTFSLLTKFEMDVHSVLDFCGLEPFAVEQTGKNQLNFRFFMGIKVIEKDQKWKII